MAAAPTAPVSPAAAPAVTPFAAPALGQTGTALDALPLGTYDDLDDAGSTAPQFMGNLRTFAGRTTLVVRLTTLQPMRAQSLAGNNTSAPSTDHAPVNGVERFWLLGQKVRGCMRTQVIHGMIDPAKCSDLNAQNGRGHCGKCFKCRFFGCFRNGAQSRVHVGDFYSTQAFAPITVRSNSLHTGNPFLRTQQMVPPGVTFLGLIGLTNPTKRELAAVVAALELAAQAGFGSDTTHYGRCRVEILAIAPGSLKTLGSAHPLIELVDQGIDATEAVRQQLAKMPVVPDALLGAAAEEAADRVSRLCPLSVGYGVVPV